MFSIPHLSNPLKLFFKDLFKGMADLKRKYKFKFKYVSVTVNLQ